MATPIPLTAPIIFVTKEKPMFIATFPQNVIAMIEQLEPISNTLEMRCDVFFFFVCT